MAAKVPQFGAWEGGENFTVFFDNARKMKTNDPEEYANMIPNINGASSQGPLSNKTRESQGKQSKVPQFGAWDNGGNVGYTLCFENARKNKTNEAQTCPPPSNPEPHEARAKVPSFGAWEDERELSYTLCFDNIKKTSIGPTRSDEPGPPVRPGVGESAGRGYGANTNGRSNEHMGHGGVRVRSDYSSSREGHMRNASREYVASVDRSEANERYGRPSVGGEAPIHSRGKPQSRSGNRGGQNPEKGTMIPPFGVWNKDPSQGDDFTGTFQRAVEERKTPPPSYYQQTQQYKYERKKRSCFSCFG